jgi:phosphopantetheinyl transferase
MPSIFLKEDRNQTIMVWRIVEPLSFFLDRLPLDETDLPSTYPERNAQWLAARYLLHVVIDQPEILKDNHQKPYLANDLRYISISHSFEVAAIMVADKPCGIDIEKDLPRLQRIATKFILPEDLPRLRSGPNYNDHLYTIWCAKEAMFKAYGLGSVNFKNHLTLDLEAIMRGDPSFNGALINESVSLQFKLNYEQIDQQYHLVYGALK